jgi:hypothetical protein
MLPNLSNFPPPDKIPDSKGISKPDHHMRVMTGQHRNTASVALFATDVDR